MTPTPDGIAEDGTKSNEARVLNAKTSPSPRIPRKKAKLETPLNSLKKLLLEVS